MVLPVPIAEGDPGHVAAHNGLHTSVNALPATYVPLATVDAAGDLLVGTADNTVGRLAKGTALDVLRTNAAGTALEWAAAASSGAPLGSVGQPLTFLMDRGQKDAAVVIVSDSTNDVAGEWGDLWARKLAAKYPEYTVKIRFWVVASTDYGAPTTIQTGTGARTLEVYNFGISGSGASIVTTNFTNAFTVPFPVAASASVEPGPTMVIFAVGHNMNVISLTNRKDMLTQVRKIRAHYPATAIVISGQNPKTSATALYAEGLVTALSMAEVAGTEGFGFVNVMQAFFDVGNYDSLVPDGTHPNATGSELWAAEVDKHFLRGTRAQPIRQRDAVDFQTVPAGAFAPSIGTPVLGVPASGLVAGYLMDDATQEAVVALWSPPTHWRGVGIKVRIAHNGVAGTGITRWKVDVTRLRTDLQSAIATITTVSAPAGSQFGIVTADITPSAPFLLADMFGATFPESPELIFRVSRMGADAADVGVGDVAFLGLTLTRWY